LDEDKYRLVVPAKERQKLIIDIHTTVGHGGVDKVLYVAHQSYYWPGMDREIQNQVKSCFHCQLTKGKPARDKAPFQPTLVQEPFERIAMDISGPYHQSKHGYRFILAIIDYFSKYTVLIPLKRIDAETVAIKTFKYWIAIFGAPQVIHTDRGSNFESELFREQCALMGIHKTRTSPYYPQSDGLVERLFRTIKPLLSSTVRSRAISWCEALPFVEMGLRCSVQATTGFSPFEILFGKSMRLPLCWQNTPSVSNKELRTTSQYIQDLQQKLKRTKETVMEHVKIAVNKQAERYNYKKINTELQVGDSVLVKVEGQVPAKFPKIKFCGPYQVLKKNNHWSYQLLEPNSGKVVDRNYNQIKKLHGCQKATDLKSARETSIESASHRPTQTVQPSKPASYHSTTSQLSTGHQPAMDVPVHVPTSPSNAPHVAGSTARRYPLRQHQQPTRLGHHL
jgi:hypothetical protein